MRFKDGVTMEKKTSENVCKDPRRIDKRRMNGLKTRLNDVTTFGSEYQIKKSLEADTGFCEVIEQEIKSSHAKFSL